MPWDDVLIYYIYIFNNSIFFLLFFSNTNIFVFSFIYFFPRERLEINKIVQIKINIDINKFGNIRKDQRRPLNGSFDKQGRNEIGIKRGI